MPPSPSLQNPRRTPRIPIRLPVDVVQGGDAWRAETADLGPGGCLVVSSRPLVPRTALRLVVRSSAVPDVLAVSASVAWAAGGRGGVAFGPSQPRAGVAPAAWFRKLLNAMPALAVDAPRVPERVELDAAVFLRRPPNELPPLSRDELALVGAVENGLRLEPLFARAGLTGERASRALFGLLQKRVLTLSLGDSGEAWRWRALLARGGTRPAGATSGPTATPLPSIVRQRQAPVVEPTPARPSPPVLPRATPIPFSTPLPDPRPLAAATPVPRPAPAAPAPPGLPPATSRSAKAQMLLDEAKDAAAAGRIHDQAIPLLRRALSIAPRDPEIAAMLGELAFKDRRPSRI
ncbi:MAG: PilZ domain-containing protein [Anaeromyxobacteraceae bacterium]